MKKKRLAIFWIGTAVILLAVILSAIGLANCSRTARTFESDLKVTGETVRTDPAIPKESVVGEDTDDPGTPTDGEDTDDPGTPTDGEDTDDPGIPISDENGSSAGANSGTSAAGQGTEETTVQDTADETVIELPDVDF